MSGRVGGVTRYCGLVIRMLGWSFEVDTVSCLVRLLRHQFEKRMASPSSMLRLSLEASLEGDAYLYQL